MIHRLRRKFILIAMGAVTLVMIMMLSWDTQNETGVP